ncbi:MAG: radical SAM protein [Bacteroidales bacterium]|nr:radical SAM protein [Bacteroidales bacterium]
MLMYDSFHRKINYLRISVTDRCNFRCIYCMPEEGVKSIPHQQILRYEEIIDFVKVAVNFGIDKVRITGGEPLVRKGIISFIEMLSNIEGITDLSLTTNGYFLFEMAESIKKAGISRINISLDTINPEKFYSITRGGDVNVVIKGILKAKELGFNPIKINAVKSIQSDKEIEELKQFAKQYNLELRFIQLMNLKEGIFSKVEGGEGGSCELCNRLRLTADGYLMPCLFSNIKYNIREYGYEKAIQLAVQNKPACGKNNQSRHFYNIGG